MSSFGLITLAFGRPKYMRQAENLALSLRRFMPHCQLALQTDHPNPDRSLFDIILPLDSRFGRGVVQKLGLFENSPFEETLFIDSDCICLREFSEFIPQLRAREFATVGAKYLKPGDEDEHISDLATALRGLGIDRFPKFNGGLYYFRKTPLAEKVFACAHEALNRSAELGLKNFDAAGPGDETLFALAMEQCGVPLFDDEERLMRTPLGATSPIQLDPLNGGCSYEKNGRTFEPNILHFCGPLACGPEYRFCETVLRENPTPRVYAQLRRKLRWQQTLFGIPRQRLSRIYLIRWIYFRLRSLSG